MSAYENYNITSTYFDKTRYALGIEIIRKEIEANVLPPKKQIIIDAGCGTGLYSEAVIDEVKFIEAVDVNYAMINRAKTRLKNKNNIHFHITKMDKLPFEKDYADCILVNQVLHHLSEKEANCWIEHKKVFKEFFRILKPKGILIINSCSKEQLIKGFWYYHLIPDALNYILEKTIDLYTLSKILKHIGFSNLNYEIPVNLTLQGNEYFNDNGLFSKEWRSGDSIWSLVSKENLENILTKISKLKYSKKLKEYIKEHDKKRYSCGQITFTLARK